MTRRFMRCFVVVALAVITLLWPLLVSPHRIDEAHRKLIREGMTAADVESIFGAPAGTYDWAVVDDSSQRLLLLYYLARLEAAQSEAMRQAARIELAFADQVDGVFEWPGDTQTWTSRHGSVTISFNHAGRVRIFDITGAPWTPAAVAGVPPSTLPNSFVAYGPSVTGGIFIAAGDVNGDGVADIITGAGKPAASRVNAFSGATGALLSTFVAYPGFRGGVRVGLVDINGDGLRELVTAGGPGAAQPLRFLNFVGQSLADPRFAFGGFPGGVFVTGQVRS